MTLINVRVTASRRQPTLHDLAASLEGECWTGEYTVTGWTWEYAFPTLEQAQQFLALLPTDYQGVLEVIPDPPVLPLETPEPPSVPPALRQPPKLFAFMDWSDRAAALGLRLSRYGTRVFALRREADGELMADDLTWEQAAALLEQLEGKVQP